QAARSWAHGSWSGPAEALRALPDPITAKSRHRWPTECRLRSGATGGELPWPSATPGACATHHGPDGPRIGVGALGQLLDHPALFGERAILAELELALQTRDWDFEGDDGAHHFAEIALGERHLPRLREAALVQVHETV